MTEPAVVRHEHLPVFRVLRAGRSKPLDVSYSQRKPGRWNTTDFPALYCCCSEKTAKAVVRDRFNLAAADLEDLQPEYFPRLFEIEWTGRVADVATEAGIVAAGFLKTYPEGTAHEATRPSAERWRRLGHEGVVCRSASVWRLGLRDWSGACLEWGELAVFVDVAARQPALKGRRTDLTWLY